MRNEGTIGVGAFAAWSTLFILLLIAVVAYIDRSIIALMIDPIRHDLNVSDFKLSLVQGAAFAVFYAICGVPMGWVVDTFPRRLTLYVGITLWSLAAASCGLAHSYNALFLARIAVGVGEATLMPAAYSMIGDLFPKRRLGQAVSIFAMGSILGTAASMGLGGVVIARLNELGPVALPVVGVLKPWQFAFVLTGLPGVLIALLVFLIPHIPRTTSSRKTADPDLFGFVRFLKARRRYMALSILGFGGMSLLGVSLLSWFPTYMIREFGAEVDDIGVICGLIAALVGIPSFLLAGWSVDKWFSKGVSNAHFRCGIIAVLFMGVCAVAGFSVENRVVAFFTFGMILFASAYSGVAALSHLQIITPSPLRGRVTSLFMLFFILCGIGAGPSVVAFFTDFVLQDPGKIGASLVLTFAIFAPLSACLLALGLRPATEAVDQLGEFAPDPQREGPADVQPPTSSSELLRFVK